LHIDDAGVAPEGSPVITEQQINQFVAEKRWEELETSLRDAIPQAAGLIRFACLVNLSTAYQATARLELAREAIAKAEHFAQETELKLSGPYLIGLAEAHERIGNFEAAREVLCRIEAASELRAHADRMSDSFDRAIWHKDARDRVQHSRLLNRWNELETVTKELLQSIETEMRHDRCYYLLILAKAYRANAKAEFAQNVLEEMEALVNGSSETNEHERFQLALEFECHAMLERSLRMIDLPFATPELKQFQNAMLWRLSSALGNQERYSSSPVRIIALGQDCLPNNLAQRWGLGTLCVDGPFGAGVFRGDGVATAIEDDFAAFSDRASFTLNNSASGIPSAMLLRYKTIFNHETGEAWIDGDLTRLRDFYARRIANFRHAMREEKLLLICSRISISHVDRLWNALKTTSPMSRKSLIIFDFLNDASLDDEIHDDGVRVVKTAYPQTAKEYIWHVAPSYNSEAGVAFEKSLVGPILEEIERLSQ